MSEEDDERWMRRALAEARVAAWRGEVPVGCVLVDAAGREVSAGHNLRELLQDPMAHAEVEAMRRASRVRNSWRLDDLTAYVTLEPCAMCAGAFVNARVPRVVYGCDDPRAGAVRSLYRLGEDPRLNHRYAVVSGVLADECAELLRGFFRALRARRG
ncbi:MAG: tRNA adenosine(34) deaminase TadA [Polyangiales bacterium]